MTCGSATMRKTLSVLTSALAEGRETSTRLVREALERIEEPAGEGARTFLKLYKESALASAAAWDALRASSMPMPPFAGIPISIKDLFDVKGESTTAGSKVLAHAPPAASTAPAVARLCEAGFVVLGKTNMSEFAFSGLGLNPHFGTPASPFDRATRRVSGGSSSGAAVSVADGMAYAGIGSDTGGSCRIPAAMCGITGYKPTASSVPCRGVFPLSTSLDSVGSIANSVECCRLVHGVMSGERLKKVELSAKGLRLAVPQSIVLDDLDTATASAFERVLSKLSDAGVVICKISLSVFESATAIGAKGGFPAAEAYARHRSILAEKSDMYDPRVRKRILRGELQSSADYIDILELRARFISEAEREIAPFDAIVMPTVPIVPPSAALLETCDEEFTRTNLLVLRNPTMINLMDGCSISIPMTIGDEPPAGLMLSARGGQDAHLFDVAQAVEQCLRQ